MHITLVRGDVCTQDVDAVVTAANEPLRGGGGVDHAVHLAAGPELMRALRPLAPCPAGGAVVTRSFDLQPPSISTGSYGYPLAEAAVLSVAALRESETEVERVVLVAFGREVERAWHSALDEVAA